MKINCPNCSQKLELMQNAAGQIINCPTCESDIIIPDFESEASSDLLDVYSMPEKIRNGVFIIPISLIVSLVIGITYSLLNFYIPIFGITTILFMGGFVGLNAYLIYICAKYTKCTSRHYLLFCGLLAGLFGLYSSWVTFEACLLLDWYANPSSVLWLINPINLINLVILNHFLVPKVVLN